MPSLLWHTVRPTCAVIIMNEFSLRLIYSTGLSLRVLSTMLVVASGLVLVMALSSAFNTQPEKWFGHPDEYLHRSAARYYLDHWLPPKVGDPATMDSYSREYGLSYLNEPDIVYFLAGKFAALLSPILPHPDHAFRLFNVFLFSILALSCAGRAKESLVFLPIVLSPQIWYLFSYFNGDAFPLFVSILIAYQLAVPSSAFNRWMMSGQVRTYLWGAILLGTMIGLLILSKKNYYSFLAVVPAVLAFRLFGIAAGIFTSLLLLLAIGVHLGRETNLLSFSPTTLFSAAVGIMTFMLVTIFANPDSRRHRAAILLKLVVVGGIAALVAAPRMIVDDLQHGSLRNKDAMVREMSEQLARSEYKPSKIYAGDPGGYYGSALRAKGLKFKDIFRPPWEWHIKTFQSATGNYGWLEFRAPGIYYRVVGLAYLALFGYLAWRIARSGDRGLQALSLAVTGFSVILIAIAAYYSWTRDFQAQGRYLFPVLGMLSLILQSAKRYVSEPICMGMAAFCFLLSCYSFVFVGLAEIPKSGFFKSIFL